MDYHVSYSVLWYFAIVVWPFATPPILPRNIELLWSIEVFCHSRDDVFCLTYPNLAVNI